MSRRNDAAASDFLGCLCLMVLAQAVWWAAWIFFPHLF